MQRSQRLKMTEPMKKLAPSRVAAKKEEKTRKKRNLFQKNTIRRPRRLMLRISISRSMLKL
jgi:hypothetical protein